MAKASTHEQLKAAYALIKTGDLQGAQTILRPIIKAEPHNTDAWWLLANSFPERDNQIKALQHLLTLDPDAEHAHKALAKLQQRPATSAAAPSPTAARPVNMILILVGLLIWGAVLAVAVYGMTDIFEDDGTDAQRQTPDVTERVVVVQPPPADAAAVGAGTVSSAATVTRVPARVFATLPPLIIPTETIPATVITNTPRPTLRLPPSPTPGVAAFAPASGDGEVPGLDTTSGGGAAPPLGSDYWYGYDRAMTQSQNNGRYYRFYEFPVSIWVGRPPNPNWNTYIDAAIAQVGEVVPMQRTSSEADADIILDFAPGEQVTAFCGGTSITPQPVVTIGCGGLTYDQDKYMLTGDVAYIGFAFIALEQQTDAQARLVILHELLHAVGISVHSQDPRDIMYFRYGAFGEPQSQTMTERDYNTLRRLYNSPAFGER